MLVFAFVSDPEVVSAYAVVGTYAGEFFGTWAIVLAVVYCIDLIRKYGE